MRQGGCVKEFGISRVWDPTSALEAMAAADVAMWSWSPAENLLRLFGGTFSMGLSPLGGECSSEAFFAMANPQDRILAASLLRQGQEGERIEERIRMRSGDAGLWRGIWLEDGLRAAGVVVSEPRYSTIERDNLTGLLTRKTFFDRARHLLSIGGGYELVVADLDRMNRLNEALGHDGGDQVLATLGARLAAAFPAGALPARVGEDEFAVLAPDGVSRPLERLRAALEQPLRISGIDIFPKLSIGSARVEARELGMEPVELLRRAELAVKSVKVGGRGGEAGYGDALETQGANRLELEAELRLAFSRGEIVPFFQPIVRLETGAVAGFEAWQSPKRGLVPPDSFLPIVQDLGMMNDLGLLMMEASAHQLSKWLKKYPQAGKLFCSVNLSTTELEREGLCEDVERILQETSLPRGALKLEITESDIMQNPDEAAKVLQQIKDSGASLALDDFGTGFSSLSYLARLPFDTLKIDRYFVRTMGADEGSAKIVKSIVTLGRDLALEVVAEGVENAPLAEALLGVGCHYGQGFGYARPLPASEAEVYLHESLLDGAAPLKTRP